MLSIKGREPFIRMHLWLNDPHNIEKLQAMKDERDSLKRKRVEQQNQPTTDSNPNSPTDATDPYSSGSAESPGSAKKSRAYFSVRQKEALKVAFSLDPYPGPSALEFLSQELNLEPRSIINWFHNHRMRLKPVHPHDIESLMPPKEDRPALDPSQFRLLVNQRLFELSDTEQTSPPPGLDLSSGLGAAGAGGADAPIIGSDTEEDSRHSAKDGAGDDGDLGGGGGSRGRSRRKPLAPQWVNPAVAAAAAATAETTASGGLNGDDKMEEEEEQEVPKDEEQVKEKQF